MPPWLSSSCRFLAGGLGPVPLPSPAAPSLNFHITFDVICFPLSTYLSYTHYRSVEIAPRRHSLKKHFRCPLFAGPVRCFFPTAKKKLFTTYITYPLAPPPPLCPLTGYLFNSSLTITTFTSLILTLDQRYTKRLSL